MSDSLSNKPAEEPADELLLRGWIEQRDRDAADLLIRRHERSLYAFSLRISRSESEAAEIVQESVLRMLQRAGQFRGGSAVRTWLFGIALNVARSRRFKWLRFKATFRPLEADEEKMLKPDSNQRIQHEQLKQLDEAVSALPKSSRVPILLHYYEGFSYEEMAEILDCSPGTVASRLNTARKRLEKSLKSSQLQLPALASLSLLKAQQESALPGSLQQALRAMPQQLANSTAPLATGLSVAKFATAIGAVLFLGASSVFFSEINWRHTSPSKKPNSATNAAAPVTATTLKHSESEISPCEEWAYHPTQNRVVAASPSTGTNASQPKTEVFSLRVSGFVRDPRHVDDSVCHSLKLQSIWPKIKDGDVEKTWQVQTDSSGYYELSVEGLLSGVYELSVDHAGKEAVVSLPWVIDLRQDLSSRHDFDWTAFQHAAERDLLLQPSKEELSRALQSRWKEASQSAVSVRVLNSGIENIEAAVLSLQKEELGPAVQVFEPVQGKLLLGPLPAGHVRIELVAPGVGFVILPDVLIEDQEIVATTATMPEKVETGNFFSCEVFSDVGTPVSQATVEIMPAELWSHLPVMTGTTDLHGKACFEDLPQSHSGNWSVRVLPPQHYPSHSPASSVCDVPSNAAPLRVVLD